MASLRYRGAEIPSMKKLDEAGDTILLGSFSKIAFPGLRVGWAIGPRHIIARLTEAKEASDLHSDQLSQAVLLRFADVRTIGGASPKNADWRCCPIESYSSACEKETAGGCEFHQA